MNKTSHPEQKTFPRREAIRLGLAGLTGGLAGYIAGNKGEVLTQADYFKFPSPGSWIDYNFRPSDWKRGSDEIPVIGRDNEYVRISFSTSGKTELCVYENGKIIQHTTDTKFLPLIPINPKAHYDFQFKGFLLNQNICVDFLDKKTIFQKMMEGQNIFDGEGTDLEEYYQKHFSRFFLIRPMSGFKSLKEYWEQPPYKLDSLQLKGDPVCYRANHIEDLIDADYGTWMTYWENRRSYRNFDDFMKNHVPTNRFTASSAETREC